MDAFTAYIFQEDHGKLTDEVIHTSEKGGSLFGQWTSTGNPVVHLAVSFNASRSETERIADTFSNAFRLCHIGEWRPVRSSRGGSDHTDHTETRAREVLLANYRGGRPTRFLVLDVDRTRIIPFLFEGQFQKGKGKLEILPGVNPFNRYQPTRSNYNPQRPDPPAAAAGQHWNQARPAPQFQEAATTEFQWYSGDDGGQKLMKVLEDFKEIAQRNQVDFSRDKITHDISMSFVDARSGKNWEVKFPPKFPKAGARLIENADKSYRKETRQGTSEKASQAVKNMIAIIQGKLY
ncbi:hypothetical protein OS493_026264 [Desmophyllum pertusum]|uniref:Uncharacterized protein n=1 Tax=Desmophyllum pertusum TaxID=174260 RepID=A0A9W9ZL54_9CNID|nr:hypothetical protein OS493_026264 [Desmophyllum pertusum]